MGRIETNVRSVKEVVKELVKALLRVCHCFIFTEQIGIHVDIHIGDS